MNENSLIKNYSERPKYPELLRTDFIKRYESTDVDVAAWLAPILSTKENDPNNSLFR